MNNYSNIRKIESIYAPPLAACSCVSSRFIPSALCHLGHISASAGLGHHSFTPEPKPNSWHPKAAELCPRTMLSISSVSFRLLARPSPWRGEPPRLYVNEEHSGKH